VNTPAPTSLTVVIPDVLLSYCYLAQPYQGKPDKTGKVPKAQFTTHGVFAREHAANKLITDAIITVAKNAWGEELTEQAVIQADGSSIIQQMPKWQAMIQQFKQENKLPLRDGNRRQPIAEPYKNNLFISMNNERRPKVVVTRGGVNIEIGPDDPQYPYSGCRANLICDIWAQGHPKKPNAFGSRINAQWAGIQFLAHGTKLGGGGRTADLDEFGICPADADAPPPGASAASAAPVSLL
jgi:hypothetical protein